MTIHHDWETLEASELHRLARPRGLWSARPGSRAIGMTAGKRLFDVTLALCLLIPLSVVMLSVAIALAVAQGRPVLYVSDRMRAPSEPFRLLKFRTMTLIDDDSGVTGAHKHWRITPLGHFLRRSRIDELPQLFNILKGDMSFVGPRPTIREYVDRFPEAYGQVLRCPPGVTGLATLIYHRHEARILARCKTADATEAAYSRRCLPTKLKLDMIYQRNQSLPLDLWIMWRTLLIVITQKDERIRRRGRS